MALHLFPSLFPRNPTTRQELQPFRTPSSVRLSQRILCSAKAPPLRRSANYQQSLWNDSYIQSLTSDAVVVVMTSCACRIDELKNEVRRLINKASGIVDQLELIDALQQLGVAYHFKEEIKDLLASISELFLGAGVAPSCIFISCVAVEICPSAWARSGSRFRASLKANLQKVFTLEALGVVLRGRPSDAQVSRDSRQQM